MQGPASGFCYASAGNEGTLVCLSVIHGEFCAFCESVDRLIPSAEASGSAILSCYGGLGTAIAAFASIPQYVEHAAGRFPIAWVLHAARSFYLR